MLRPIDFSNTATAVNLLGKGFPARSRRYWVNALHNIREFGGNGAAGVPVGYIWEDGGVACGVVLTPASVRQRPDGSRERIINLASWYMDPAQRWRAPLMMRTILRQPDAVFTDLTPTPAVQQMLPAFGFRQLTQGVAVNLLALAALRGSKAVVRDLAEAPAGAVDGSTRRLLEEHARFGCLPAGLVRGDAWLPLLFKSRKVARVPAALLLYSESNSALYRDLGAVARYLLRRGKLLLVLDLPFAAGVPGIERMAKTPRFAKGGTFEDRTDHAGSELALFDW